MQSIRDLLTSARQRIPGLDAQVLLAEVLSVDRAVLLAHPEAIPSVEQADRFGAWVERAAAGDPALRERLAAHLRAAVRRKFIAAVLVVDAVFVGGALPWWFSR